MGTIEGAPYSHPQRKSKESPTVQSITITMIKWGLTVLIFWDVLHYLNLCHTGYTTITITTTFNLRLYYPLVNEQFAIGNGPVETVFRFPMRNGDDFYNYGTVYQRVTIIN